ncbi:EamA family transporter [Roseovarius sp. C7]|uniref:EamA family transporter n=1 Tax=Roseovarius sp. C7 TaxID=3398643 RepID=UPI0039F6612C
MELWIILSIAAAAFQTLRFMVQKRLSMGALSAGGATWARFVYAAPLALMLAAGYAALIGWRPNGMGALFWLFALCGGLAQILATWCVVALFARRNFAVGITFKKTEVIQTALVGFVVLGDRISGLALGAILLGLIGVLILSDGVATGGRGFGRFANRSAALGLTSGALFAVSAVGYRGATLEIGSEDALMRAATTLAMVTSAQTLGLGAWLGWREPGEVTRVWRARRQAIWMGVMGLGGSLCWFTAFTQQNAALVFAVGQIEVIFSMLVAVLVFREKITGRELCGIALLTASILALVGLG